MSDILGAIDDTLTDWNGSKDSMHWQPGSPETVQEPRTEGVRVFALARGGAPRREPQDPMSEYLNSMTRALDLLRPLTTFGKLPPSQPPGAH